MKKLIALDIDGTLYNDEKKIETKTIHALIQAQEKGCVLILASGRPTAGLVGIARQLQMDGYHGLLLAYNGGVVTDCSTNQNIYANTIPLSTAKGLLRYLESFPVTPVVDDGVSIYTTDPNGFQVAYESSSNQLQIVQVANISDELTFEPAKILIAAPEPVLLQHMEKIEQPYLTELSFIRSAPFYLEATPKGVHKAESLRMVCDKLGFSKEELIAFGDAQNDLSMIELAGIGIAMGNACTELKRAADMITKDNNQNGIAYALEKLGITDKD